MSLNIDMKMIRPLYCFGDLLILDMNSWTLLQSCNEVNPGKYSTRIPMAHHQIVSKVLYCGELLNHVNLSSQQYLIVVSGVSFQGTTQNLKTHEPSRARD